MATGSTVTLAFLDGTMDVVLAAKTIGTQKLTTKYVDVTAAATSNATSDAAIAYFDDTTSGGGSGSTGTAFTLTTNADSTLTGGSGDDTYSAVASDTTATTDTFNVSDVINGGAGSDTLNLIFTGVSTATTLAPAEVSGIETINVRALQTTAATVTTVTASNFTDAISFNADRATSALTFTGLAQGQAVGVKGNGTIANGNVGATYAASATSATLNISNGTTAGTVTEVGAGLTSTTLNSTGAANTLTNLVLAGTNNVALTINATESISTGNITGFTGTTSTITASGAATNVAETSTAAESGAVNLGTIEAATVKTINASGLTAGGITATLNANTTISVTGGAGSDFITTGAVLASGGIVAAGSGTDTLITAVANIATAAVGARYTGFENLRTTNAGAVDASFVTGISEIAVSDATQVTNLTAAQALKLRVFTDTGADSQTFALATATGTSDVATITLGSGALDTSEASDLNALTVTGFETLNLVATPGASAIAANKTSVVGSFVGATLANINLTGTAFNITNAATTLASTINASALTGDGATTSLGLTLAGTLVADSSVTGSALADSFTIGAAGSTYIGGAGADGFTTTVAILANDGVGDNTIDGGLGTDTLTVSSATTLNDNHFVNLTGMENLVVLGAGNAISVTNLASGAKAAYATGITVTSSAVQTGENAYTWTSGLYDKAVTLTDSTSQVGTTSNTSITTGAGADNITVTATSWVGSTGAHGQILVSTGAGVDTISVTTGTLVAHSTTAAVSITGGTGADVITSVGVNAATDLTVTYNVAAGDSTTTAYDTITNFDMGTGALLSSTLNFDTATLAAYAATAATGFSAAEFAVAVSAAGVVTFSGTHAATATLAEQIAAVKSVVITTTGHTAMFTNTDSLGVVSTYVFNNDAAGDSLVDLVGVTGVSLVTTNVTTAGAIFIA
jgi:hypothetical protein